jgi:hypothetical protein
LEAQLAEKRIKENSAELMIKKKFWMKSKTSQGKRRSFRS